MSLPAFYDADVPGRCAYCGEAFVEDDTCPRCPGEHRRPGRAERRLRRLGVEDRESAWAELMAE